MEHGGATAVFSLQPFGHPTAGVSLSRMGEEEMPRAIANARASLRVAVASQTLRTVALSERKSVSKSCHAAGFTLRYPCVWGLPKWSKWRHWA
ncbi:MAG: hypothetical protein V7K40_21655 [Nostoc sp.]